MTREQGTTWSRAAEAAFVPALRGRASAEEAAHMRAYMRDQFPFLGVRMPEVMATWRDVRDRVGTTHGPPTADDLVAFAEAMWRRPEREHHLAGAKVLDAASRRRDLGGLRPAHLDRVRTLILTHSWWDTVDVLAPNVVGALAREYPRDVLPVLDRWIDDENVWLVRSALLHQLKAKDGTDPDRLARHCLAAARHDDFFVRKAIGWALRAYSYVDPGWVETFVAAQAHVLAPLSRREARKAMERGR